MATGYFITGLDIGTNNIKVLVVSKQPQNKTLQVLAQAEVQNEGMRKGVIISVGQVSQKIREALDICKDSLDRKIDSVLVNINGSHLSFVPSRALVSVSRADQKISESDVERVLQASRAISISSNQDILEVFPQEFIIDGQAGIKEVLGLKGMRLEAKTLCLVAFSPYFKNLSETVLETDIEAENIIPSVLASSKAVLSQKEKELGVAVVEIGAGNTGLAVFQEDSLVHARVLPLGSNNITNDIAIVFKIEVDEAERIKREFSGFGQRGFSKKEKRGKFSQKALARVVESRTKEILREVSRELKMIGADKLPAGIVLTGGGAKLPRLVDFTKKELKLPCRLGLPKGFTPEIDDPSWATVAGLVLEGARSFEEKGTIFSKGGIFDKMKEVIKNFIP